MEQNLAGYLLHALDPDETREVEAYLRTDPEARTRLEFLEQGVAPLATDTEVDAPPRDLVLNTLARIAEHKSRSLPAAPRLSPQQVEAPMRRWSRRADVFVAALLLVIVGSLGAPFLVKQWQMYHRQACVKNLMTFWEALASYSDQHEGAFPQVQPQGSMSVAGIFVPLLTDSGVLSADANVLCPAQGERPPARYTTPDLEEMYRARRDEFNLVARDLGGSYAYSLGYRDGKYLLGLRQGDDGLLPILADRLTYADQNISPNHGGTGQNVLYIGGHVQWKTLRTVGVNNDDIYVNKDFKVSAGKDRFDTVLGTSDASPYPPQE